MDELCFFITRNVICDKTNLYWNEAIKQIRLFYPNEKIFIICSNSISTFIKSFEDYSNIVIFTHNQPNAREFLYYYYFYTLKPAKIAIFLQDSTFILNKIDIDNINNIKYIWHFSSNDLNEKDLNLLNYFDNSSDIINYLNNISDNTYKTCCNGLLSIITYDYIKHLQDTYNFLKLYHAKIF